MNVIKKVASFDIWFGLLYVYVDQEIYGDVYK